MRYELVRVAQLVFTLVVMFGAFSAGLAAGWLHWGRAHREEPERRNGIDDVPRIVKPDLFSPAVVPAMRDVAGRLGSGVTSSLQRWTDDVDVVDAEIVGFEQIAGS